MSKTVADIDAAIKVLETEKQKLLAQADELRQMSAEQKLAVHLQSVFPMRDDSWDYEFFSNGTHNWSGSSHQWYIVKARNIISMVNAK